MLKKTYFYLLRQDIFLTFSILADVPRIPFTKYWF